MNAFTIKDLENLSGVKAHTIRIWEQRYGFLSPQRTETNIRVYNNDELKTLLNVALLNKYGFKISHIDRMTDDEIREKVLSLSQSHAQQERIINELIECMIELDMFRFEHILNQYIASRGIEKTITQIIFAFLERIGILWITNHINPAQEHLVTNVVRQKLVAGIESCNPHLQHAMSAVLFLPEHEHHELGLLFMYYLLKVRGVKVWYLGADVPMEDLRFLLELKKPDFAYTHLTTVGNNFNFENFVEQANAMLDGQSLVISGQLVRNYRQKLPPKVFNPQTLHEALDLLLHPA